MHDLNDKTVNQMSGNVLIACSSESLKESITAALKDSNCKVQHVKDADNIIDNLENLNIDLLITDTRLKEINGLKLLKAFRSIEKFKKAPGLIMVDPSEKALKCRARAAGATGWLLKPPEKKQLLQLVQKIFP